MLYKRILKWLGILFSSVFLASFLFSYNLSSRGFFDFEQYLDDLKAMALEVRESVSGEDSEADGSQDGDSEGEVGGEFDEDKAGELEDPGYGFTDEVLYENLNEYRGKNPYTSFLSDRIIVRDMRYLVGSEYYKHLIKSIPDAEEVYYDDESKTYTIMGKNEVLVDKLSGIIQLRDTGQMYIAYIRDGNIHYHTNDREYGDTLVKNTYMNKWIKENKGGREIIYFNR